jgi:multiple sugar transport system substrate-binding protein
MRKNALLKVFIIVVIVALIIPSSLIARAQEPVKLRFTVWVGPGAAMDMLNSIAADYNLQHSNVTVQFDTIPFNEYTAKLTLQLAGSNPPDGGWILENTAPQFVASGVLSELTPMLNSAKDYAADDFEKSALALWEKDNTLYAVPFSTSPFLVIYNEDMFKAAKLETPSELTAKDKWTWEALASAAQKIKETQSVYGFESVDANVYKPGGFWSTMMPIIRAFGGEAWDSSNTCLLSSQEAVAGVQFYHDMVFKAKSAVAPGENADFYTGKSAMTIGQISRLTKLDEAKFKWGIAPLPKGPDGEAPTTGQAALAVFNNSRNKDVALDFLVFMTDKTNSATLAQVFPSARKSVLTSDAFLNSNKRLKPEQMKLVVDAIGKGRVIPSHPNFSQISLASGAIFDELWNADANVADVMGKACEAITPLLAQ